MTLTDLKQSASTTSKLACWIYYLVLFSFFSYLTLTVLQSRIPFDTDEADHANAALELYHWVKQGDVTGIGQAIARQSFYPPLSSLTILPAYLIFGPTIASSRLPSILLMLLAIWLMFLSLKRAEPKATVSIAQIAALLALMLLSPVLALNGSLCMIELLGVAAGALCILFACGSQHNRRAVLLGLGSAIVFLSKYNFGIMILPAVFFAEFVVRSPEGLAVKVRRFSLSLIAFLAIIGLFLTFANLASVRQFFIGHPSYAPLLSADNLFFDLRSWINHYECSVFLGLASLTFCVYGAWATWQRFSTRFAAGLVLTTFTVLLLSTTNEVRHFIIAAPGIWFLASIGVGYFCQWVSEKYSKPWLAYSLLTIILLLSAQDIRAFIFNLPRLIRQEQEGQSSYADLQEFIANNIDPSQATLVSGAFDSFSLESIRWHVAVAGRKAYSQVRVDPFPYREDKSRSAVLRNRNVDIAHNDPSLRSSDLATFIASKRYSSLVVISKLGAAGKQGSEQQAIINAMSSYPAQSLRIGAIAVNIFKIS